ncbi:MAG: gamma-glutamyltransferase [Rickettsiales bacterium]|nr:gamma-glutamyltransferase [Rickettsiales bacterium]
MKSCCKFFTAFFLLFALSQNANSNGTTNNDSWTGESAAKIRNLRTISGKKYMIASADELASKAGQAMIEQGGNAIDAAIATQMVLNVVEPHSSGIGGGGFLLYYHAKTAKTIYFNGRETAPAASFSTMFLDKNGNARDFTDVVRGGLSVGTPGLLKMFKEAHDKYGKLPWATLFEPAIEIARKGFVVNDRMRALSTQISYLKDFDESAEIYLTKDKKPKAIGDIITNQKLAATLETIAEEGIDPFYKGQIAQDIVNAVRNSKVNPGTLSLKDLANYQTTTGDLICGTYRVKYKICSMPLPSSGGITLLQILGILENFDLANLRPDSKEAVHLITEASRLAYADRNEYIADINNVPVTQMLDKLYLRQRSKLIRTSRAMAKASAGKFSNPEIIANKFTKGKAVEPPSTTHISIVDEDGNAVSLTTSIEYFFGSALSVDGFMLNNQLTDFSLTPFANGKYVANRLRAGKQPRSSLTPTLVFDQNDKLLMVVGSPGGPRIIQFTLKAILNHLDWGMDIQKAIAAPNFVALNGAVELEENTAVAKLKPQLEEMGHKVKVIDIVSGIHAITIDDRKLKGGADPRRNGVAIGL